MIVGGLLTKPSTFMGAVSVDDNNPNPIKTTPPPVQPHEDMEHRLKMMSVYKDNPPTYI